MDWKVYMTCQQKTTESLGGHSMQIEVETSQNRTTPSWKVLLPSKF